MKEKVKEFFKGIGTIALYFGISFLGSILLGNYYFSDNLVIATISQLAIYIIMLIVMVIIYRERLKEDFQNFDKKYVEVALRNWIIGFACMIVFNTIINSFIHRMPVNESLNRDLLRNYPISNILAITLMGPIIEEITFRLSFKKAFSKWYTFALTTAFFFGLAHIADFNLTELIFIIPYGALGFFMAKAFYETDNILTSMIMHIMHNTLAMAIILIFGL